MGLYSAYIGATRGPQEPISLKPVAERVTKREAYAALLRALGGKKAQSGIVRRGHSFFAVPSKS